MLVIRYSFCYEKDKNLHLSMQKGNSGAAKNSESENISQCTLRAKRTLTMNTGLGHESAKFYTYL
jgi:hypothetical protein